MNLKEFLKSLPIVNQLAEILSDYNIVTAGLLLVLSGVVSELGIQNGDDIAAALLYLSGLFAAGYTLYDMIELYQKGKWNSK